MSMEFEAKNIRIKNNNSANLRDKYVCRNVNKNSINCMTPAAADERKSLRERHKSTLFTSD